MAMLLKMYQKMKLIRERNLTELALTQVTSKKDRITKNIEKTQKRYTSLFANIDAQAKQMQSQAKLAFQNMFGLGMNSYGNYLDPSSFSGMNGFIVSTMGQMLLNGGKPIENKTKDASGNEITLSAEFNESKYQEMLAYYMQNGTFKKLVDESDNTKYQTDSDGLPMYEGGYTYAEVSYFMQAMQNAKNMQQQAQMQCNNMSMQYDTNVSVWQEAAKAQLEAEQDAVVEPLTYQETMWDLEKTQLETKLKRIEADLQAYDQSLDQEAKNQAPKFGV